jgi:hypothetical protein
MRGRQQQQQQHTGRMSRHRAHHYSNNSSPATRSKSYFKLIVTILFLIVIAIMVLRNPRIPEGTKRKQTNTQEMLRSTVAWGINRWYPTIGNTTSVSKSKGTLE